jgi:hypothetical protein
MSEKHDNFVRLAAARVEAVADAIRILSNLSGPSYEWDTGEVLAIFAEIDAAKDKALQRFRETRRWVEPQAPALPASTTVEEPIALMADVVHDDEADQHLVENAGVVDNNIVSHADKSDQDVLDGDAQSTDNIPQTKKQRRKKLIGDVLRHAQTNDEDLAEMIVLQREVIANQQAQLEERAK